MDNITRIAEEFTGLEGKEALFALIVNAVQEYQTFDGEQVTLKEAEHNLDTTLQAIKENIQD